MDQLKMVPSKYQVMQVRLFILCILFFLTSSFFWEDEEKHLRQLHQNGEAAIQKQEFEEAIEIFRELLGKVSVSPTSKYHVDWTTYVDLVVRLAEAYEALCETSEAQLTLDMLLAKKPPEEFLPRVRLMKARLTKKPTDAYLQMKRVSLLYPTGEWEGKNLSLFHALEYSLNEYYDDLVRKAKQFLTAGFYQEAISTYQEILTAIVEGTYPKAQTPDSLLPKKMRYRLAECHFLAAEYEQTLHLCEKQQCEDEIDREMLYLAALCYREKKEYERAVELFQNYTNSADRNVLNHFDHALFETALFYYRSGNILKAREFFERLQQFKTKPALVAALYLARIHLADNEPNEVERLLEPVMEHLSSKDPSRYECDYLRGMAAYSLEKYDQAKCFFERSLPGQRAIALQALYHLGWCYVRLGDDSQRGKEERLRFFNKAEKLFKQLLNTKQNEEAALSLARLCLLRSQHFEDRRALSYLETLLKEKEDQFSFGAKVDALLMRAEATESYEERETLYCRATEAQYKHTPSYAQGWYYRGLNHFQEGLKDAAHKPYYFELAAEAFEQAFGLIHKNDLKKAAHILMLEAKANLYRNSPITSLALLEKLLNQFTETVQEREETLYLRGLIASHLTDLSYFPIAEESLLQIIHQYPNGKYIDDALNVLATLYFGSENYEEAKKTFMRLATEYPESPYAPEAWFWAAEATLNLGGNPFIYRQHVYEDYPTCEKAPEAYFRQYAYGEYLKGETNALNHLKKFENLFPHSSLCIVVNYLVGKNEEDFQKAVPAFEKSLFAFSTYSKNASAVDSAYVYFYYQSMLDLSQRYSVEGCEKKHLEKCEKLLTAIVKDFSEKDHPFTSLLKQKTPYPPLFVEAEYFLVQYYLKKGQELMAQRCLSKMMTHFNEAGVERGYYLSQVWIEQGKLAMSCEDYDTALNCFDIATECGKEYLSNDEKLSLWILESGCFRGKKEYDTAMRLLSKVINAETASPLRLKAMYLRSEIYELEGRPELAMRQLEATAKKGGEWALQAKEKLRVEYGME